MNREVFFQVNKDMVAGRYRGLLKTARHLLPEDGLKQIRKAFNMALEACPYKKSHTNEPFIFHSIAIAKVTIEEIGLGRSSVVAALLFSYVEDGLIDIEKIRSTFGEKVVEIITGLTRISVIDTKNTTFQAENFRKLLLSLSTDVRVILIKLAERLHFMRTMEGLNPDDQFRIATETFYLYAPLGHRLGLYNLKSELEDLSLKYTDSTTYNTIVRKLTDTTATRNRFIKEFIKPIQEELSKQSFNFDIKGRTKSVFSIYNKMKKQGVEFEEVYDIFAIRVILNSESKSEKADCWRVYSVVADLYQPNPLRMRDWISIPKSNGYESLHTTVVVPGGKWVEVQIRTNRMNEIAEKGLAAHWKYKGGQGEAGLDQWLTKIREVLEAPDTETVDFLDNLKPSLYNKEIFVFTPNGDLRRLPAGATVLDFAFDIHSGLGQTCVGAKVNNKNVPIRYVLNNGDKVEVLSSKNQYPKSDWLSFVVTSKAKAKIKQIIKEEATREAEQGREILRRRFRNWKITFNDVNVSKLLKLFKVKSSIELYSLVALDKVDFSHIKEVLTTKVDTQKSPERIDDALVEKIIKNPTASSDDYLIIDEKVDNVDFKLAKCCRPIFGDSIFGFVTVNEGIKIHRMNCPNASRLMEFYGYRVVKAKWTQTDGSALYQADIRITGVDDIGLLSRVSDVISKDLKVNMRSLSINTNDGMFEGNISLFVKDTQHLDALINKLKKVKGVLATSRISS
jgi:GTP diphosphokinase / guanosine-3',5'-bis(diphosphate) 3'-diphosphatase